MDSLNIFCPHTDTFNIISASGSWSRQNLFDRLRRDEIISNADLIYLPPTIIPIPDKLKMRHALLEYKPSDLTLLPRKGAIRDIIPYLEDDVVHLIATRPNMSFSVNYYKVPSQEFGKRDYASPSETVSSVLERTNKPIKVYKPLSTTFPKNVGELDRSTLVEVGLEILADVYPWGCGPGEIHFILYDS